MEKRQTEQDSNFGKMINALWDAFFCCANTISFSLAKQCSIMFCHLQMLYFEYFVGSLVEFSTLSKYRKWPDMTSLIDFLFWRKIYRYCILHCKY